MSTPVRPAQRYTKERPCPVCCGLDGKPRGIGERCYGFLSQDGKWAHCTREEFAGELERNAESGTYAHRLDSTCRCGETHDGRAHRSAAGRLVVETYDYRDPSGTLLSQVVRTDPKGFYQRRPDGNGNWINGVQGVPRAIYRLPELIARLRELPEDQRQVSMVEGEKDVDRLWSLGIPATTNAGGAGKWTDSHSRQLRDAGALRAVVIPDNDVAGQSHATSVCESLARVGIEVRKAALPGLELEQLDHGEDVSDWLDQGHTPDELIQVLAHAQPFQPSAPSNGLQLVSIGQLLEEPEEEKEWLVEGLLPVGGVSAIVSKPKVGKTTAVRDLALCISRGLPWLGRATKKGKVVYFALEEKRSQVRGHFRKMGACAADSILIHVAAMPHDAYAEVERVVREKRPDFVILDTFIRFARLKDINDYAGVSLALEPLINLARETCTHISVVHHEGKTERALGDGILGSTALLASVDTAVILKRREKYRTVCSIQRYGEDMAETVLALDADTGRVSDGGSPEAADREAMGDSLLRGMKELPEPAEEKVILELVEGRKSVKQDALRRLLKDGDVQRSGAGKKGDPYLYSVSSFLPPSSPAPAREVESQNAVSPSGEEINSTSQKDHQTGLDFQTGEAVFADERSGSDLGSELLPPAYAHKDEIEEGADRLSADRQSIYAASHNSASSGPDAKAREAESDPSLTGDRQAVSAEGSVSEGGWRATAAEHGWEEVPATEIVCRMCGETRQRPGDSPVVCGSCDPPAPSPDVEWLN